MRFKSFLFILVFLLTSTIAMAQNQAPLEKENIFIVFKDIQGEKLEGYLRLDPSELTVSTKDNQEKSVPLKMIEFIKLEKIHSGLPGAEQMGEES